MKKILASLLLSPLLLTSVSAQVANPVYFPCYDAFTSAAGSGGSSYAPGSLLGGILTNAFGQQTNAFGQVWYGIDTAASTNNAIKLTGNSLSYPGVTGFSGNQIILTNVAGPGARMFVWPVNIVSVGGSGGFFQTGPASVFYSFVMQVSNVNSLGAGGYICGFGDNGTPGNQNNQPGTVSTRLFMKSAAGGYQVGLAKMTTVSYAPTIYTTNQVLFIVVDYEIQTSDLNNGKGDVVRLWINPVTNTFGASTQPAETLNAGAGVDSNLTPDTSCFQFYDIANAPNNTLITAFRMGTNWSWVTGGPCIGIQPPGTTNAPPGSVLDLSVLAMNNGSPNTYTWQFNGTNLTDGSSISGSGATVTNSATATLTISNIGNLDAGSYTVVVSNLYGAVTSLVSTVTTLGAPSIIAQSGSTNVLLYVGGTNTILLTTQGAAPLTYLWYSNNTLTADTTNSFTIANIQSSANIYCIVSNSQGTATSAVVSVGAVPLPTFPYPLKVYNDHPIGFWPLNEGPDDTNGDQGTITHDYIDADNGFYTNAVLSLPGYATGLASEFNYTPATDSSTSAQFGGFSLNNSYVAQIPNINFASVGSGGPSFSVEAWVNANANAQLSGATIVDKGFTGSEQFTMDYNNGWRFYVRDAANPSVTAQTTSTSDGNWHHLVGVLDTVNSNITMYVDGVAKATTLYAPSSGILASTYPVTIGSRQATAFGPFVDNFNGNIEDVAIYNYALTASQVLSHYDAAGIGPSVGTIPSSTNLDEGTTLAINPTASGSTPLSFTWYNVTSGMTVIPGQTNLNLIISNISAATYNGSSLELVVSNIYGAVTSSPVSVTVQSGVPNSVAVTPSAITVYSDVGVPFAATATGTEPFSYQWSVNGVNILGATNATFTNATGLAPGANTIGCVVTNVDGVSSPAIATASLTVVATPSDSYATTILKDGPVAFWRLDEPSNSTTAFDYIGNHNATYTSVTNGVLGFSPGLFPAETGSAFGTNGITPSEAFEIDNTASGISLIDFSSQGANAEFSVELWVQEPAGEFGPDCLAKGFPNNTQFAVSTSPTGAFEFLVHNGSGTLLTAAGSTVVDGNWHHVVGICDEANGSIYVYVDGVRQGTVAIPTKSGVLHVVNSTYPVTIGAEETSGGGFGGITNAVLSQVALYNYALSSNSVAAHYQAATFFPLSPFSITGATDIGRTNVTLTWQTVSTHSYQVQVASSLIGGTNAWANLGAPIVATGSTTSYTDSSTNASGTAAYYRVVGH